MKGKKQPNPSSTKRIGMGNTLPWIPYNKNVIFIDPKCEKKCKEEYQTK